MFNPNEYDDDPVVLDTSYETAKLIEKRTEAIEQLDNMQLVILQECETLKKFITENPSSKAKPHMEEKLRGWSKILNGTKIVLRKYY